MRKNLCQMSPIILPHFLLLQTWLLFEKKVASIWVYFYNFWTRWLSHTPNDLLPSFSTSVQLKKFFKFSPVNHERISEFLLFLKNKNFQLKESHQWLFHENIWYLISPPIYQKGFICWNKIQLVHLLSGNCEGKL